MEVLVPDLAVEVQCLEEGGIRGPPEDLNLWGEGVVDQDAARVGVVLQQVTHERVVDHETQPLFVVFDQRPWPAVHEVTQHLSAGASAKSPPPPCLKIQRKRTDF